jgi:hypothetical protein
MGKFCAYLGAERLSHQVYFRPNRSRGAGTVDRKTGLSRNQKQLWLSRHWPTGLPMPTLETAFEVINGGRVYTVAGVDLQRWIDQRRHEWKGPKRNAV